MSLNGRFLVVLAQCHVYAVLLMVRDPFSEDERFIHLALKSMGTQSSARPRQSIPERSGRLDLTKARNFFGNLRLQPNDV